ncbi:hypothetical protein [Arthrobacter sp. P2b]|uniref:hypothetical protein n=1 Tax=Arthrobacter sp. P2b TaxID=1938741 RepID=UPI0009A6085A|nr:hypothetical protein [Arthrobacter sp. P2b]SLK09414.1 hypothetical protein SAMN06272721_11174 [Arthrobacter sp. P2b]
MSDPQTISDAPPAGRSSRPAWLLPVIVSIATSLLGMVLVAAQGLYWMIAVIAAVEALGIFTIIRSARINARRTP